MKKLIILTLLGFVLAGVGNILSNKLSLGSSTSLSSSEWAMFKELFH